MFKVFGANCFVKSENGMTVTRVVLLLALLAAFASASGNYRLPNNTEPISYDIRLVPNLVVGNFIFSGESEIFLKVLEPTFAITLHTNKLTYNETRTMLVSQDGVSQNITSYTYVEDKHFLIIGVQDELPIGNYTLRFSFVGILADDMNGFYRSSYVNASGDTVWLAATQFEATHARRAFPCYDEPALKATFHIAIKHEPELHALSNMPIAETYTDATDEKVWTIFERSPIMSTYLVAFVVSDFSAIKNSDESYNVWSRPNAISDVQYAYDVGLLVLAELEAFTNVTYNLRKMDQIPIPDFPGGGMENWGLVTYKEDFFHYNESDSTLFQKQRIATAISHEFAHQWFGNLVGPAWWKYFWLNEGFASYFQYLTTDAMQDNWGLMDQFVVTVQQGSAFIHDSTTSSTPMNQDVASPTEIESKFDIISYSKAACVIRMTSHFLTEDVFKAGLTKYLNANAFGAAVSDDLFAALQEAESEADMLPAHVRVKDVMDTWVEQSGYPVVTVTRNYTTGTTEITQERFLSEDADAADGHNYKWWIPINWASQANPDFSLTVATDWIRSSDRSMTIGGFDTSGWIIFNKQQTGYYRVNYDDTNWGMLASYLNSDNYLNIHVLNRAALIDDAINLAKAGRISYTVLLDLTLYLHREIDPVPWYPATEGFNHLDGLLANTNKYESFRAYLAFLASNVFDSSGIEETDDDHHMTRLNRPDVISFACRYGLKSCRSSAEAKLIAWLDDSAANPISPTLLNHVICAGLRSANATTWYKARDRYHAAESALEQSALLAGLGCSEDEAIINTWLNSTIHPTSGLTTQVSLSAFISVIQGSVYNVDRVLDLVINNFDSMISYFDSTTEISEIFFEIALRTTTDAQLKKLYRFHGVSSFNHWLVGDAALATIRDAESKIAWNAAHQEEINAWIVTWLANSEDRDATQGNRSTTLQTADNTAKAHKMASLETKCTTSQAYDRTTVKSLAATSYLNFFASILGFVWLFQMNLH